MTTHPSILTWKTLWTGHPGGLQSMRSQRVWHDWATEYTCKLSQHIKFFHSWSAWWQECSEKENYDFVKGVQKTLAVNTFIIQLLIMLPNHTWVCSPICNKANLLTSGCDEGKYQVYWGHQTNSPGQLVLGKPKFSDAFQKSIFKGQAREGSKDVWPSQFSDWWWGTRVASQGLTLSTLELQ